jgi:MSHA biogenesis protein MshE
MTEQAPIQKLRIGDLLAQQKVTGLRLGRVLTDLGFIGEHEFMVFLSQQLSISYVDLVHYTFNTEQVRRLPETMARRFRVIVLEDQGDTVLVGMVDPMDIFAVDELARVLKQSVRQAVVRETELLSTLDVIYRRTEDIALFAEELDEQLGDATSLFDASQLGSVEAEDAPVVKLLASIFEDAVQIKASDIHIEPDEHLLRIRQRVDGVLQEQLMKETRVAAALVLRLKLLSGLNISEKRMPQDGRFNVTVKGRVIDVRLSTMPLQHGEAVVMRLLDQSNHLTDLKRVGMPDSMRTRFERLIHKPHGLILVTGPTGSGKTTTLYGALQALNTPQRKIITAEDPVEYRVPRVNQVQIQNKIGLDFATVLRVALRQDPDVMLIGEIRDVETAGIALRAAMTGHMVLSTLHTGDALSTATRLVDMGVESFLVAASLKCVLAQRLIRMNCENCVEEYQPDPAELVWVLGARHGDSAENHTYKRGSGCSRCNNTGYLGRMGIFELLEIDAPMSVALRHGDIELLHKLADDSVGYTRLFNSALALARDGVTTLAEVARVAEIDDGDLDPLTTRRVVHDETGPLAL